MANPLPTFLHVSGTSPNLSHTFRHTPSIYFRALVSYVFQHTLLIHICHNLSVLFRHSPIVPYTFPMFFPHHCHTFRILLPLFCGPLPALVQQLVPPFLHFPTLFPRLFHTLATIFLHVSSTYLPLFPHCRHTFSHLFFKFHQFSPHFPRPVPTRFSFSNHFPHSPRPSPLFTLHFVCDCYMCVDITQMGN